MFLLSAIHDHGNQSQWAQFKNVFVCFSLFYEFAVSKTEFNASFKYTLPHTNDELLERVRRQTRLLALQFSNE